MKSIKRDHSYVQKRSAVKKHGEHGGLYKLDRKSSRGMIYENEELRLRTININAEVERGQSDIRKLRRENEQLKREIWSLRDEYDRLNKRFKANKYLPESISEHDQSESHSEDSDSCDTCRGEADINEEYLLEQHDSSRQQDSITSLSNRQYDRCSLEITECRGDQSNEQSTSTTTTQTSDNISNTPSKSRDHLHVNFDHLSIVSEENLSNSDGNLTQPNESNKQQDTNPICCYVENPAGNNVPELSSPKCMATMSLPSLIGPLTPITPIEMVANQLNDLQNIVPPLSYFENIVQQHMGPTISSTTDSKPSTISSQIAAQTNGWDYNIQSPFMYRKMHSSEPSFSNSTSTTISPAHSNSPVKCTREGLALLDASTNTNISNSNGTNKNPKHFFSPLKPRLTLDTNLASKAATCVLPTMQYLELFHPNSNPPDVFVTNALGSSYYPQPVAGNSLPSVLLPPGEPQPHGEPIYATAQKEPECLKQSLTSAESSKSSVNLDQILDEIETISEDILQMQLEKSTSQEKLTCGSSILHTHTTASSSATLKPLHQATIHTPSLPAASNLNSNQKECHQDMPVDKKRKPYRSEMNLLLSYNGQNPVIIPVTKSSTDDAILSSENAHSSIDKSALERNTNSPSPPQLPTPMAPFPTNFMYLGFERLNQPLGMNGELLFSSAKAGLNYVPASTIEATNLHVISPSASPPFPPFPGSSISDEFSVFSTRNQDVLNPVLTISSPDLSTPLSGVSLTAIAPIKRRMFSKQNDNENSSHMTRSFDGTEISITKNDPNLQFAVDMPVDIKEKLLEGNTNEISTYESSSGSEAIKRKLTRRVSIVCREEKSDQNVVSSEEHSFDRHTPTVSVDKLDDVISVPSLMLNLKHAHSTPNSPHSNRRRGVNNNLNASGNSGTLHHNGHHHHHHHHHHNRKLSQDSLAEVRGLSLASSLVTGSRDNVLGTAAIASHPHSTRFKCSRRHSEGTVSSIVGNRGGGSGGTGSTNIRFSSSGNHHHHHHHQDSNQETSISERNSGSLVSSRESSTSLSMRSQRRKISVSSHTGGKIPWCGCWGNGCL